MVKVSPRPHTPGTVNSGACCKPLYPMLSKANTASIHAQMNSRTAVPMTILYCSFSRFFPASEDISCPPWLFPVKKSRIPPKKGKIIKKATSISRFIQFLLKLRRASSHPHSTPAMPSSIWIMGPECRPKKKITTTNTRSGTIIFHPVFSTFPIAL